MTITNLVIGKIICLPSTNCGFTLIFNDGTL